MPNRIVDERMRIRPEWLKLIASYRTRFMIGSDEFLGPTGAVRAPSFRETWSLVGQLPVGLARKVGHDNAAAVYRLK